MRRELPCGFKERSSQTDGSPRARYARVIPYRSQRGLLACLPLAAGLALTARTAPAGEPICLHPDNPHYFLFGGKPTILITSGEHYGAVLNPDFDYKAYLHTLESHGFNLTRAFSGAYCEPVGAFGIRDNTLAPAAGRLLCPWARSASPGYAHGGSKFDLARWDAAYFRRLREFVSEAARRGIVVELVLFCPFYEKENHTDAMWKLSPMSAENNVNGVGNVPSTEVYTLNHPSLLTIQEAMVRRIVEELREADNVYFEICNEPYWGNVASEWQDRIAEVISDAEAHVKRKHLIAQNIANKSAKVKKPNPHVSILNFHYAKPDAVAENYDLNLAIADDETGFRGSKPEPYRFEGWNFLLAGGAVYSNLDYSFTCGKETGTATSPAPGGGGAELRRQLKVLRSFINGFDFVRMKPANSLIRRLSSEKASARTLAEPGRAYAIYLMGSGVIEILLDLPAGDYRTEWVNTQTGRLNKTESLKHGGGGLTLKSPPFEEDIALGIRRQP
jgi:hypothetical protein